MATLELKEIEIRDVWNYNFEEAAEQIREIIIKYPYVAMVSFSNLLK